MIYSEACSKVSKGQNFQCKQCGKDFYRNASYLARTPEPKFCSKPCYMESGAFAGVNKSGPRPWRKNGQTFVCQYCGDSFYRKASFIKRGITKTCGKRECISKSAQGANNPYWGKNHSPEIKAALSEMKTANPPGKRRYGPAKGSFKHTPEARAKMSEALRQRWAANRDAMLALFQTAPKPREEQRYRRNFTPWQKANWKAEKCGWCGTKDSLVLDHIFPVSAGGTNIKENAQTLCQPCNLWKSANIDRPLHLAILAVRSGSVNG